jgi:RNA polymerase sigma-70 factor (ECF subfamily)
MTISSGTANEPSSLPLGEGDDLALIRQVAAKDRQAFETLYYRYAPRLGGYLSKLLRQHELIEETLNDVMLVVWQNAARFDPATGRLSTWLFGIAHHKVLKALARSSRQRAEMSPDLPAADEAEEPDHPHDPDTPERILMRRDLGYLLARALEALPPEQRAVVELTFYHERSYQEIAAITKCPVNTVKTRMFYARRRLAQLLAGLSICRSTRGQEESE